jgi:DnaJ-class molecular chaperone
MAADDAPTTVPCSACRGTGRVISNLGGRSSEIACPWCEGRGLRLGSEHDAQAAGRRARGDDEPPDQAA